MMKFKNVQVVILICFVSTAGLWAKPSQPIDLPEPLTLEEVKTFMRDMANNIEKYHLKTNPVSPQRGIVYEYVDMNKIGELGQWIQGEGLDTMHDGAWYAAALCQAYIATGDSYYRDFLTKWQMPFYLKMMLNSDSLFAAGLDEKLKTRNNGHQWGRVWRYLGRKGWVPYWWDDGASVSAELINNGRHSRTCVDFYFIDNQENPENRLYGFSTGCSNHMAQDLGMMLMRTWLLLRDQSIAMAAMYMQDERAGRGFGEVPAILAPAALAMMDPEMIKAIPTMYSDYPTGGWLFRTLRTGEADYANSYVDEEAFYWNSQIAKYGGEVNPKMASELLYRVWSFWAANDYWYDVTGPIPGINNLDLWSRALDNNKFAQYQSDAPKHADGSRGGCQAMVYTAVGLQLLKELPGCWERIAEQKTPDSVRVYFVDEDIRLDGNAESLYGEPFDVGNMQIKAVSGMWGLYLAGRGTGRSVQFSLYSDKSNDSKEVKVTINRDGSSVAVLSDGTKLISKAAVQDSRSGWKFEFEIPYSIEKEQSRWANACETAYLSIGYDGAKRDLFFLSSEERITKRFTDKIEGGIAVWNQVLQEVGYIPTAFLYWPEITADVELRNREWLSEKADSGGYAHLMAACAQYILYKTDRTDWETANIPKIVHWD